jgi:hypothetical protein
MNDMTIYGLERLEDRVLLAVDVTFNNGTVTVTSDGDDDRVEFFEYDGNLYVAVDEDNDGGFDFYETIDADDVKKIVVKMGDGDDAVTASGIDEDISVSVDLGDGDDYFYASFYASYDGAAYATGFGTDAYGYNQIKDLKITAGDGDDAIYIYDLVLDKDLTINTDGGDDFVQVSAYTGDIDIGGKTSINLGGGDVDVLLIAADDDYNSVFNGKVSIKGSADYTYIGVHTFDTAELEFNGDVKIDLSKGDDSYTHIHTLGDEITFDGKVEFKGGDGDDDIYLYADYADINFNDDVKLDGKKGDNDLDIFEFPGFDVDFNDKFKEKNFD